MNFVQFLFLSHLAAYFVSKTLNRYIQQCLLFYNLHGSKSNNKNYQGPIVFLSS